MKQLTIFFIGLFIFSGKPYFSIAETKEIPFTLDDRDRIIRLEEKVESLRNEINAKFESQNVKFDSQQIQINDLKNLFYWGFGVMVALMIALFGYIVWDRKTVLKPVEKATRNVELNLQKLISALKEKARTDVQLAEILRTNGLLET
ncbi:MAG: hypothetical protein HY738_11050 [Bacteroidia bacterium]|nr:hypothetical protein [Bacteroidia bacterium]